MESYMTGFTWHIVSCISVRHSFSLLNTIRLHGYTIFCLSTDKLKNISVGYQQSGINESQGNYNTCLTVWGPKWLHHISFLQQGYFSTYCLLRIAIILTNVKRYLTVLLICISLITSSDEHSFHVLLDHSYYLSLEKYRFKFLAKFY